ncbi:ATP-binding protein, partial [bacterium]|nr:ATP-binding protein [bacterium]
MDWKIMRLSKRLMITLSIALVSLFLVGNYLNNNIYEVDQSIDSLTKEVKSLNVNIVDKLSPIAKNAIPIYEQCDRLIKTLDKTQITFEKGVNLRDKNYLEELNSLSDQFVENTSILKEYSFNRGVLRITYMEKQYLLYVAQAKHLIEKAMSGKSIGVKSTAKISAFSRKISELLLFQKENVKTGLQESLDELMISSTIVNDNLLEISKGASKNVSNTTWAINISLFLGIIFSLYCGLSLVKKIIIPIEKIILQIQKIDQGDFTENIKTRSFDHSGLELFERGDEIGDLAKGIENLRSGFHNTFKVNQIDWVDMARSLAMVENSQICTFFVNRLGIVKYQNPYAKIIFEVLKEYIPNYNGEILNTSITDYHKDSQKVLEIVKDDTSLPFGAIVQMGEQKIQLMVLAIYDTSNEFIGAMVTWEIITDKMDLQNKLAQVAAMAENSPVAIISADVDGIIYYINQAAIIMLNNIANELPVPVYEVVGAHLDIFHKDALYQQDILSHPENLPIESKIILGGEVFTLRVSAIYNRDGEFIGCMAVWDIITKELKQKNDELQELLIRAEQASIAKSCFLSNMSHELRTPLNGIIGFTEMMLDGALSDDQRESLNTVKVCSDNLLELINDILDLNKIEANKMTLEYKAINLEDIIYDCNEIVRNRIEDKQVELLVLVENIYSHVIGDSVRIKQVFNNLLSNAIKFTERGEIVTSAVILNEDLENICLRLSVKDSGIGIAPENQDKIFKSFEQADVSISRKYGGTGLGLSITKKILEMMGSELKLISQLGQGCEFYFDLQFKKHLDYQKNSDLMIEGRSIQGVKVIVVDDNNTSRKILIRNCKNMDLITFQARSAIEALEVIKKEKPDLALLDINMPTNNGFFLHDQLLKLDLKMKLIAVTADM